MRLAFGKATQDAHTGKRFAAIPDGGETFTTRLTILEEGAKWMMFDTDEDGQFWGRMRPHSSVPATADMMRSRHPLLHLQLDKFVRISFRPDLLQYAAMALPYAPLGENFRFQFFFAALMCHEFSHAVYALRSLPFDRGHREPFFDQGRLRYYDCSECGVEFERFMFGFSSVPTGAEWRGCAMPLSKISLESRLDSYQYLIKKHRYIISKQSRNGEKKERQRFIKANDSAAEECSPTSEQRESSEW